MKARAMKDQEAYEEEEEGQEKIKKLRMLQQQ